MVYSYHIETGRIRSDGLSPSIMFSKKLKYMYQRILTTIFVFLILVSSHLLFAQNDSSEASESKDWIDRNKNGEKDTYEDPEAAIEDRIADLIGQMTIEEKTAQMGTIYGYKRVLKDPSPTEKWKQQVWKDGIGNIDEHCNGVRGELEYVGHKEHAELLNLIQRWSILLTKAFAVFVTATLRTFRRRSESARLGTKTSFGGLERSRPRRGSASATAISTLPFSTSYAIRAGDGPLSATANLLTSSANLANNNASVFSHKAWLLL